MKLYGCIQKSKVFTRKQKNNCIVNEERTKADRTDRKQG